jgi:hypothetical protein
VKGILVQMAERGQILELKCEMPQCYHPNGRDKFESLATERRLWAPSRDHYPILSSAGGKLRADNVRLSHIECNQRDPRGGSRSGHCFLQANHWKSSPTR